MTDEEKQLLLKDLCARLPYGVVIKDTYSGHYGRLVEIGNTFAYFISELNGNTLDVQVGYVKPYLRPMSSMTEEEKKERNFYCGYKPYYEEEDCGESYLTEDDMPDYIDWLNAHQFDYRIDPLTRKTLIESGLALKAPDGMYIKPNKI